ncbi:MAG TPA: pyridoxamine 5'-phosphate oxidase family protein [Candidatus Caenarcaniphilales bacterium]|nr:pyridoxamine 5'-phosphate oxidase family protein [Candidatus Caenarcaniphilales bacterium]
MPVATHPEPVTLTRALRTFLGLPGRHATIATVNADGSPHQTVVWYLLRDDHILLNSLPGRRWPANVRRDRRASLTVEDGWDAVTLTGEVETDGDNVDQARRDIAEMAYRYMAPDDAARVIEERFSREPRIRCIFRPTSVHTHGDPR